MADVEVAVFKGGQCIDRIVRPLRQLDDGRPAVTYRKQLHAFVSGAIHLDGPPPVAPLPQVVPAEPDPPAAEPEPPGAWHRLQRQVIEAPPNARLLVDAGPGTGKTQVACARVAHLITKYGLNASSIWLISFTRTAVAEMRNRIALNLGDVEEAHSVRIATLDSHAWALYAGFDDNATLTGSHENNIAKALELVRGNEFLEAYLGTVEHLIVDEAQDIVGVRADLIAAIVERLPPECGATVFSDEAQAIFGFAEDSAGAPRGDHPGALTQRLRNGGFEDCSLTRVYRTSSPGLLSIFTDTRQILLSEEIGATGRTRVRRDIETLADGEVPFVEKQVFEASTDTFVLFRNRAEVLLASCFLMHDQVPHRIRMSGLPTCIRPWVGLCLSEQVGNYVSRTGFLKKWQSDVAGTAHDGGLSAEVAWELLVEAAGKTHSLVDVRRLRSVLGRAQPPAEFCQAELGTRGPILGTIHASKGREANEVHLMLPRPCTDAKKCNLDEETRILFVGATRARRLLKIGRGYGNHRAGSIKPSGRAYHVKQDSRAQMEIGHEGSRAQMEIGHEGDVTAEGIVGTSTCESSASAHVLQVRLGAFTGLPLSVSAEAGPAPDYRYAMISTNGKLPMGTLTDRVNHDLFEIGNKIREHQGGGNRRPPAFLNHLYIIGIRTIVLGPDSPETETLHEPWRHSGILLAPIVLGYTTAPFFIQHGG